MEGSVGCKGCLGLMLALCPQGISPLAFTELWVSVLIQVGKHSNVKVLMFESSRKSMRESSFVLNEPI